MALVWIMRQRPGESSSIPEKGLILSSWRAIKRPPAIEAAMKMSAAMKCQ